MTLRPDDVLALELGRTALILLDYQNYNVHPDGYWASVTPGLVDRVAPALGRTAAGLTTTEPPASPISR